MKKLLILATLLAFSGFAASGCTDSSLEENPEIKVGNPGDGGPSPSRMTAPDGGGAPEGAPGAGGAMDMPSKE